MGKRTVKKIWLILLGICLLLGGCSNGQGDGNGPNGKEPNLQEEIKTILTSLSEITQIELIYLGEQNGYRILLSPYEDGLVYRAEDEANVLQEVLPFSQFSLAMDLADGSVFLASCQTPKGRVPVIEAETFKEAALAYPQELLSYFRNSSLWSEYSLEDYTIRSSEIKSSGTCTATVSFVCDVTPSYTSFDDTLGYYWSQGGKDKKVQKREVSITLYGFDGNFSCSPVYPVFLEEAEEYPPKGPPLYSPIVYEDGWQAMVEGKETEDVFYEEASIAFVIGTRLEQSNSTEGTFFSNIYQIDTKKNNQKKTLIADLPEGLIYVTPFAKKGDWLFCTSSYAEPYASASSGQVISMNLKTGEFEILLPKESSLMGSKGDWFYFTVMGEKEGDQEGIYRLNIKDDGVQRLASLPGEKYHTADYSSFINYMEGNNIYFSWPNEADILQEYTFFMLDSERGRIAQLK